MKVLIIFLSLVFVAGCVTGGSTNRAVADVGWYRDTFNPRCKLTETPRECTDLYYRIKQQTRPPRSSSVRRYAFNCISDQCPAGPNFVSCVWDCVNEAND